MNFEAEFRTLEIKADNLKETFETEMDSLKEYVKTLKESYEEAENFTKDFLKCCEERGIEVVGIQRWSDKLKDSSNYAFCSAGSVFGDGRFDGWPAIWSAVECFGIAGGCGNSGQHNITKEASAKLVDGVYELKNGSWRRL